MVCHAKKFKDLLPQEARQEFSSLVEEGKTVSRASLQAAVDVTDSAARSMTLAVTVHRSSWLQSSGFTHEVQQTFQDHPFEGSSLFLEQSDAKLHGLKDTRATLKSLGLHTSAASRKHYRTQQAGWYFALPASRTHRGERTGGLGIDLRQLSPWIQ